jgi:hypothetical protein
MLQGGASTFCAGAASVYSTTAPPAAERSPAAAPAGQQRSAIAGTGVTCICVRVKPLQIPIDALARPMAYYLAAERTCAQSSGMQLCAGTGLACAAAHHGHINNKMAVRAQIQIDAGTICGARRSRARWATSRARTGVAYSFERAQHWQQHITGTASINSAPRHLCKSGRAPKRARGNRRARDHTY